jgi:putative transposase
LERINEGRGKPSALRCDDGPEYISQDLIEWAYQEQITLLYIQPGKPTQKAYVERFNCTARNEWLELNSFEDIEHAQLLATQWQWSYNNGRPHSSIGGSSAKTTTVIDKFFIFS